MLRLLLPLVLLVVLQTVSSQRIICLDILVTDFFEVQLEIETNAIPHCSDAEEQALRTALEIQMKEALEELAEILNGFLGGTVKLCDNSRRRRLALSSSGEEQVLNDFDLSSSLTSTTDEESRRQLYGTFYYKGGIKCRFCWIDNSDRARKLQQEAEKSLATPTSPAVRQPSPVQQHSKVVFNSTMPAGTHQRRLGCTMKEIVSYETFEDMKAPGWSISKIESAPSYTHFLGRFSSWQQTDKLFLVPTRSLYTEVKFDFYEFDSWDGDSLYILIDGEWISLGKFSSAVDEGNRNGHHAQSGVSWWMHSLSAPTNAAFNNYPDQKHRFKVKVPARFTNRDGELKVGFQFATSDWITNESGGIDNVKVTSVYRCPHTEHDTHKERKSYQSPWSNKNHCIRRLVKENFEDGQITGWQHGRLDFQEGFSRFLGRYGKDEWTKKVFPVPTSAKSVRLQFDFYEFDDWGGSNHDDRFHFLINGESVHLNKFQDKDELFQSGKTSAGLRWSTRWLNTGKKRAANAAFNDQKHRVWVDIPPNVYSYDSSLHIRFMVSTDEDLSNESGGVDNLFLLGLFDSCEGGQSQYPNVKLLPNGEFYVIVEGQDGFTSVDEVQVLIKEAIMAKVNDYLVTPFPAGHCLENKQPFARVVLSQKQTWDDANGCPS